MLGAGDARRRDRRLPRRRPDLRTSSRPTPTPRPAPRSSPIRAAGRAAPCAPGSTPPRSRAAAPAPFLVVNADLPCVTPRDLLALAGAIPDRRARARGGRRRHDERARASRRRTSSCRSTAPGSAARFAALAPRVPRRGAEPRRRRRHGRRPRARARPARAAHARRARRAAARQPRHEGRRALGRSRRRPLPSRAGRGRALPRRSPSIGNVGDDVEVLGLHVSPDLDSILYALAGLADEERGWGRADETLERARDRRPSSAARAGFGSATATSGCTSCAPSCCAQGQPLSAVTARLASAFGLECTPAAGDRRSAADVRRDAGGHVRLPGVVRRARPSRRGRRAPLRGRAGRAAGARSDRSARSRRR